MPSRKPWFDLHDDSLEAPDVSILGLPFEGGTSRHGGAAAAPARLRDISRTSDPITRRGGIIEGITLRDFGDVLSSPGGVELTPRGYLDLAAERVAGLPKGSFTIVLGGDNSVSIAALRGFVERHGQKVGVLWFDAHPDLFEVYNANLDSHACALRRAMTLTGFSPANVVLLATRSFSLEERRFIDEQGIEVVTSTEWLAARDEAILERIAKRFQGLNAVYLAVDIDGFDSSCAPGTGYPMPGGVGGETFFRLLERLFRNLPLRAMDITEISPALDRNDVTSFLGVQVVLETLGALALEPSPGPRR